IERLPQFARFVGGKVRAMVAPDGQPSSDHPRYLELILEARMENIPAIRRALERLDMPTALLDDAKLLATELLTNSIRHSGLRPDEVIHLTAQWSGTTLRITVRDRARSAEPPPIVGSIRPSPGAESGWGLYLVDRIASRWGITFEGGTSYWLELEPPTEPERL